MLDFLSQYKLTFIALIILGLLYIADSKLFLVNKGFQVDKPAESVPTITQQTIPSPTLNHTNAPVPSRATQLPRMPAPTALPTTLPPVTYSPLPTTTPIPSVSPSLPSDLRQYVYSVVQLRCSNIINQSQPISGSGVVIENRGYILTTKHLMLGFNVVAGSLYAARNCDVYLTSPDDLYNSKLAYKATLVSILTDYDIAILKIVKDASNNNIDSATGLQSLDMSDNTPQTGDRVFTIGYPSIAGYEFHITTGLIIGLPIIQNHEVIKTDALISSGNSGGALLDGQGHFIGIPTFGDPGVSGGYAIEIRSIKKWAQYVIQNTSNLSSEQIISRTVEIMANPF